MCGSDRRCPGRPSSSEVGAVGAIAPIPERNGGAPHTHGSGSRNVWRTGSYISCRMQRMPAPVWPPPETLEGVGGPHTRSVRTHRVRQRSRSAPRFLGQAGKLLPTQGAFQSAGGVEDRGPCVTARRFVVPGVTTSPLGLPLRECCQGRMAGKFVVPKVRRWRASGTPSGDSKPPGGPGRVPHKEAGGRDREGLPAESGAPLVGLPGAVFPTRP